MTKRNPYDLLTYRRFDVVIKYLYAANQSSEFYKEMYRSHLKAMNNFRERDPYKRGFDAFDKAFKSVINNLAETPPIPVNDLGHITNGAHRLAAALYLNKFVDTVGSELTALADYQYFIKRGLKKFVMQRTAIEYAKLKSNSYVICLFPIAHSRMWEVKNIIMKYANIFYESTEELNPIGQLGLMKEIYLVEGWANEAGIQRKSDQCFRGENQVTFMLVDAPSLETVKEMKAKIREEFNIGNHSVHICDYHEDTIRIAKTVFNDNSIHFLNKRKNVSFPNYTKLMADMKPNDNQVITGSAVLSLYGLRDCRDLDLIYHDNAPDDSHNKFLKNQYQLRLDNIMDNPRFYLHYQGFKYASLDVVKKMKQIRGEVKDANDLKLIRQIR